MPEQETEKRCWSVIPTREDSKKVRLLKLLLWYWGYRWFKKISS